MDYKKGEMVKHPSRPEWGLGKVLEDSRDYKVRIFFTEDGWKTLSLKHVEPIKITGKEARHPALGHLWVKDGGGSKNQSIQKSKELFLRTYPEGFYGQAYLDSERNSKVAAHELALNLLGSEQMGALLGQKEYEEICKRSLKVLSATNLVIPSEKMVLKNSLKDSGNMALFSESLFQLLYGKEDMEERFHSFSRTLAAIKVAKWATLSYFPFIVFPDQYVLIKPLVT